jgi:hypothetical protein
MGNPGINGYDLALAITSDSSGNVYVTGMIDGWGTGSDFATIKYTQVTSPPATPPPSGEGGGGGGFCFIATAAYGSYLDSHVEMLREFRDQHLVTNPMGSALVSTYCKLSPPVAEFIDDHPALKPVVRAALLLAVGLSTVAVNTTSAQKAAIVGALLLVSALAVVWMRRRRTSLLLGLGEK